jgi:hypothetical protein
MPEIKKTKGEFREGDVITLSIDFTGDALSSFYTEKRFTAFAERDVKWDTITEEYYYELDKGEIFESLNSDDLEVAELVAGRLFVRFMYKDLQGNEHEITEVTQILPKRETVISEDIIEDYETTFGNVQSFYNVDTTFTFSNDASVMMTSGSSVSKTFDVGGYYVLTVDTDWTNLEYSNGDKVVWDSSPADLLASTPGGYFGGGSIDNQTLVESVTSNYLVKENLEREIKLDTSFSKSFDNNINAPMRGVLVDNSTYTYTLEGDNRIEYVEIDFGDGEKTRMYDINFEKTHIYKRSGVHDLKYTVQTIHELPEITYRQTISNTIQVEVDPFFYKFFTSLMDSGIYNGPGFEDLCKSWGIQMDRLYGETQTFIDSIDSNNIDDKFITSFATTYGDFPEIYEKIGFKENSKKYDNDKRFDTFASYSFFDRVGSGDLTSEEKQQFVRYIQETKDRLGGKGTPATLEKVISFFALTANIKELWTRFEYQDQERRIYLDEVFDGGETENHTKITSNRISMPGTDNEDNLISNRRDTSYIEINTFDNVKNEYFTDSSEVVTKNGKKYLKLSLDE